MKPILSLALLSAAVLVAACSSDSSSSTTNYPDSGAADSSPTGSDSGAMADSGTAADAGATLDAETTNDASTAQDAATGADAAVQSINGCTTYVDHTATSDARTLTWDFPIATSADRCTQIKVGQSVTWNGSFSEHPLQALNGDTPNPITSSGVSGESATITFTAAGTFGYHCAVHASMLGAIQVIP